MLDFHVNALFDISVKGSETTDSAQSFDFSHSSNTTKTILSKEDLKTYLKCVSHQYEIFPELKYFSMRPCGIRNFIFQLCSHSLFSSVRRVSILFPEVFHLDFLKQLTSMLLRNLEPSEGGEEQPSLSIREFTDFLVELDRQFPVQKRSDFYDNCFTVLKSSLCPIAAGLDSVKLPVSEIENLIKVHLRDVAISLIESNVHSEFRSDLTPILDLSQHFKVPYELKNKVVQQQRTVKIRALVKSRKWQIAEQLASNIQLRRSLFLDLVGEKYYAQADEIYHKCSLQGYVQAVTGGQLKEQEDEERRAYLSLPDNVSSRIIIVNDLSSLNAAASALVSCRGSSHGHDSCQVEYTFVGVDAEWRAILAYKNRGEETGASILQISTVTEVYIFDLDTLGNTNLENSTDVIDRASTVLSEIFCRTDIVKVGWAFSQNDISMLKLAANGIFASCFNTPKSILNLPKMYETLLESKESFVLRKSHGLSVSDCCKHCFGLPLNKSEQVSNWAVRPLSDRQIRYASLDAHCMLAILDRVSKEMNFAECWTGASDKYPVIDEKRMILENGENGGVTDSWQLYMQ